MQTLISVPDPIFEEAENLAQQLGLSRSELYAKALRAYLKKYESQSITAQLDQVYSQENSELDPLMAQMQWMSIIPEDG